MKKGLVALSGFAAAMGGGLAYLKKKDICPRCEVKKALAKTKIHYVKDEMYNNGAALTPPMGWSSWNLFRDKINENLLKEEQMQREAEALLASLGIDLGVVLTTNNAVVNSQVVITDEEDEIPDGIDESVQYFSPSRDELKSSLKIDSVKKNILKQIKEYR